MIAMQIVLACAALAFIVTGFVIDRNMDYDAPMWMIFPLVVAGTVCGVVAIMLFGR